MPAVAEDAAVDADRLLAQLRDRKAERVLARSRSTSDRAARDEAWRKAYFAALEGRVIASYRYPGEDACA